MKHNFKEPTGYYDRRGNAICDGDKICGIFISTNVKGRVKKIGSEWRLIGYEWDFVKDDFNVALRYIKPLDILGE